MSKNWLIIGAATVVIIGGYWLLRGSYQTQTPPPTPTPTPIEETNPPFGGETSQVPNEFNVTISTDGKFNPAELAVKQGDKVTWTNNDTKEHRVASVPHPIHTALPGFDSITNLGAGETYSFTFAKKGTWGYHDHLNPDTTGTVIVE